MNAYASSKISDSALVPDVQSYTRSAVFTLGKTSETTGYWSHALQVKKVLIFLLKLFVIEMYLNIFQYAVMKLVPSWVRTIAGLRMNKIFRDEYYTQLAQNKITSVK